MAVGGPTVTLNFRGDADQLKREIRSIGIAVAGVAGTVGVLGGIGAAASATVVAVAALPAAFLGIGIAAAAQSEQVKTAFTQMKDHVVAETQRLAKPIEAELLRTATSIEAAFNRIAPIPRAHFRDGCAAPAHVHRRDDRARRECDARFRDGHS